MANSTRIRKALRLSQSAATEPLCLTYRRKEARDALYLFACHVEWRTKQSLVEYKELLAAIDDHDCYIRTLVKELLARSSSRPAY